MAKKKHQDPEVDALITICDILQPLEFMQQRRILDYVAERFPVIKEDETVELTEDPEGVPI